MHALIIKNKNFILLAVILMDLLTGMEFDLFVPSFPELKALFDLSPFWVEALLSVNFLGYCLSLFCVGVLADRYGRRLIILLGLLIFILGSIFCVWAPSYALLLTGRLLQGIGIAAPSILSFLLISDLYPVKQQQSLIAMLNAVMNIAVACAPIVGSYVALYFHWRGNFIALLLLGIFTLVIAVVFIPTYQLPKKHEDLSPSSYSAIFKSKPLMILIAHIIFMCIPYWIFVGMSPLLYMKSLGVSLSEFGYYQGSLALVFAVGCVWCGRVLSHYNQKKMLSFTNQIFMMSLIATVIITVIDSYNPLVITLTLLIFVVGQIIPSIILYPLMLSVVPKAKGRISALMQGSRLILTAISLQIAGYYYQGSFQNIGIILAVFMILAIITMFGVLKNYEAMVGNQS